MTAVASAGIRPVPARPACGAAVGGDRGLRARSSVPIVLFLVLNIGQIFYALYISFWDWGTRGPREFLGLGNYQQLLGNPIFWKAIQNTLYYAILVVPLQMALGLFLAVIVNQKIQGQTFFRAAFYFPAIASSAAITVLFLFIFAPDGLFNGVREALGLNPLFEALGFGPNQNWFGDSRTALNMVILLNAWTTSGTMMLFYLSFLQSIPREIYEAAAIDGAGWWQTFRRVTFPLLAPAHFFVATVSIIGALQLFDQAIIAGGPGGQPEQRPDDDRAVPLPLGDRRVRLRLRRGRGDRAVHDHLLGHPRPAPAVRPGPVVVAGGAR